MPINQTEMALAGLSIRIARLEKDPCADPFILDCLKDYRNMILTRLQIVTGLPVQNHLKELL